jgi:tape measure domain-containing protein
MASILQYALDLKTSTFDKPLRDSEKLLDQFKSKAEQGTGSTTALAAGFAGAGAAAAAFAVGTQAALGVLGAYAEFDGLVRGLKTIEGTAEATEARIANLRETAKAPGLGFEEAVRGDIRLRSVGLTADLSERSLRAFGNALATVGGGKAELDGVLIALTQIQSKGKVSAEEINQIAERLPQLRAAMSAAFGTADSEAIQRSGISTTAFISGVVAELEKLPQVTSGARNALDNYDDAWKQLKNTAAEFAQDMAGSWVRDVTGAFNQATRDLEKLKNLLGIETPGLQGNDGQTGAAKEAAAEVERAAKLAQANEQDRVDAANRSADFWAQKEAERTEALRREAQIREQEEAASRERIRKLNEDYFAATLTEEQNLQRRIEALKAAGPSGVDAANSATDLAAKEAIAQRTVQILALEKELAALRKQSADDAAREAQAASEKAAAKARETAAQTLASRAFAAQNAILAARAAGDNARATRLEREARVEELKLQIMRDQNLTAEQATAAARERVTLEERAARAAAATGQRTETLRERIRRERQERIQALRDADRGEERRLINPARARQALERANDGIDPGRVVRDRDRAGRRDADPVLTEVKAINSRISQLASA